MAKVGIDLHTFEMLRDHGGPLTTSQLAEKSGAAPELLGGFCCEIVPYMKPLVTGSHG